MQMSYKHDIFYTAAMSISSEGVRDRQMSDVRLLVSECGRVQKQNLNSDTLNYSVIPKHFALSNSSDLLIFLIKIFWVENPEMPKHSKIVKIYTSHK